MSVESAFMHFYYRHRRFTKRLSLEGCIERRLTKSGGILVFDHSAYQVRFIYPNGREVGVPHKGGRLPVEARN